MIAFLMIPALEMVNPVTKRAGESTLIAGKKSPQPTWDRIATGTAIVTAALNRVFHGTIGLRRLRTLSHRLSACICVVGMVVSMFCVNEILFRLGVNKSKMLQKRRNRISVVPFVRTSVSEMSLWLKRT